MLNSLAYIFILGLGLGYVFNKLRLPSLVGMLITGIILGSYGLDLLHESILNISIELRQVALVIILMRAGLALNINDLKKAGRAAVLMCFVPACFEIVGIMLIAPKILGISLLDAAILGTVVAAVSPAVVVPKMLKLMELKRGTNKSIPQIIMAGGSIDDIFVIVLFSAATTLAMGGEVDASSFAQIPISIVLGIILGVCSGLIATLFFKRFHMRDSIKLLLILSISFLFLGLESLLKDRLAISGLLAVMTMGITLLSKYPVLAKRLSPKLNKLWVGAEVLLFVLVGATVDISYAQSAGLAAVAVIGFAVIFRMTGVFVSLARTPLNYKERLFCMIAYMPKATVQAAIGSIPLSLGLACGHIVLTVAVLAILITAPLGAFGIDMTYKKLLE